MCRLLDPDLPPEALNSTSRLCCLKALGQLQPAAWQGPEMWWLLVLSSLVQVGGVLPPGASAVCPCFCPWPWGSAVPRLAELLPVGLLWELRWAGTPQILGLQGTKDTQQAQSTLHTSSFQLAVLSGIAQKWRLQPVGMQCVGMLVLRVSSSVHSPQELCSQTGISNIYTISAFLCIAQCSCCINLHVASECRAEASEPLTVYQVAQL